MVILIYLNLFNNLTFQDIYAIPSRDMANSNSNQRLIYFLSIVDVLTHYGVKKAAAKVTEYKIQSRQLKMKIFECQIFLLCRQQRR